AGAEGERKLSQRRELVPLFGWISQNPFDPPCVVIDANNKVFPAGNDQGIIRAIVISGIVMEPISWRRINELTGIISSGPHGCADNICQIPCLQQRTG